MVRRRPSAAGEPGATEFAGSIGLPGPPPASLGAAEKRLAPAPALAAVPGRVVSHGRRDLPFVALTFDACETRQHAGFDRGIVAILKREGVPATLFLGGHWMWSHPAETRMLAAARGPDGRPLFELGNHSFLHGHFPRECDRDVSRELALTQAVAYRLTGQQGRVARAPYGECTPAATRAAAALGLTLIEWDVVTGDPDPHVSANAIVRAVRERVRPGSILIMHVNGRGRHTAEALPRVLAEIRRRGLQCVTVSALLARDDEGRRNRL
jgi:peptidoglycan-N-acetylglucosamine deacetylase